MDSEPFDVQHVRESAGKGSPAGSGKWATTEHSKPPSGKKLVQSGKPAGWKPARKSTTTNRDAFEKRLAGLKRSNPDKYATLMRRAQHD